MAGTLSFTQAKSGCEVFRLVWQKRALTTDKEGTPMTSNGVWARPRLAFGLTLLFFLFLGVAVVPVEAACTCNSKGTLAGGCTATMACGGVGSSCSCKADKKVVCACLCSCRTTGDTRAEVWCTHLLCPPRTGSLKEHKKIDLGGIDQPLGFLHKEGDPQGAMVAASDAPCLGLWLESLAKKGTSKSNTPASKEAVR